MQNRGSRFDPLGPDTGPETMKAFSEDSVYWVGDTLAWTNEGVDYKITRHASATELKFWVVGTLQGNVVESSYGGETRYTWTAAATGAHIEILADSSVVGYGGASWHCDGADYEYNPGGGSHGCFYPEFRWVDPTMGIGGVPCPDVTPPAASSVWSEGTLASSGDCDGHFNSAVLHFMGASVWGIFSVAAAPASSGASLVLVGLGLAQAGKGYEKIVEGIGCLMQA